MFCRDQWDLPPKNHLCPITPFSSSGTFYWLVENTDFNGVRVWKPPLLFDQRKEIKMGGFCCYSKQSKAGHYIRWALRVIARNTFFWVPYLNVKKISFVLWEQNRLKQSFATSFPSQRTLRLCPSCSARKVKTCWCTCATLLQNVKKNLRITHLVLIYWALLPTQTVIMSWNKRIRWVGTGWQGRSCFSMGSEDWKEEN